MPISKKHHYIPRFFLKGFTNPDGNFYVYDKKTDKIWLTRPENAFTENYRNTSVMAHTETGEISKTDLPEEMLSYFDSKAATLLQELIASKVSDVFITPERLYEIRLFIMTTFWRSPANDHLREDIINSHSFKDLGFGFYNKDGVRDEEAETIIKTADLWRRIYPALLPVAATLKKNKVANNDDWRIAYRTSDVHLVTDNPIILKEYTGIKSLQKDLIAPLSSRHLLIVTNSLSAESLPSEFNLQTDLLLFHRATRYAASSSKSYLEFVVRESAKLNKPGWEDLLVNSIFQHLRSTKK